MNFIGALIIVGFGIHIALRMRVRNPKDAVVGIAGYYTVFYLVILFGSIVLPRQILSTEKQVNNNWSQVFDRAAGAGNSAGQVVYNLTGIGDGVQEVVEYQTYVPPTPVTPSTLPPTPQVTVVREIASADTYTVEAGDTLNNLASRFGVSVNQIRELNGLSGDLIMVGQKLYISVQDTVTPEPTAVVVATPTPGVIAALPDSGDTPSLTDYYNDLGIAKHNGDIVAGNQLIEAIIQINPGDDIARAEQRNIQDAQEKRRLWTLLGDIEGAFDIDNDIRSRVASSLSGYTYEIIDDGAKTFAALCSEFSTIRVTAHGWLWNEEITVPRCYLADLYDVVMSGDTFSTK